MTIWRLGMSDGSENQKRKKFDKKLAKELFETEFNARLPSSNTAYLQYRIDYMRKYNP